MIYDVAIIGAGPGGGRAAISCALAGLKTIILEKKKIVGLPVHCGECLSTYALKNTGLSLPEHLIAKYVKGVQVIFPDGSAKKLFESGYVLHKEKFEQWLIKTACNNGANLQLNSRVVTLNRHNKIWTIITESGEKLKTKILIDASGVLSVTNKLLKLCRPFRAISGIQYQIKGIDTDDFINFYLWPRLADEGYLWIIPKHENICNVGLVSTNPHNIKQRLDRFIKINNFKIIKIEKFFGGRLPASGPLAETYLEGLMIIGDAAGFTSPLFEGGTHLALKSGCIAADIAKKAILANDFSKKMFLEYQKQWKKIFPDYRTLLKGKEACFNISDTILNLLGGYIPNEIHDFPRYKKALTGLRILFQHPGLLTKGNISIMKSFEYSRAEYYGW